MTTTAIAPSTSEAHVAHADELALELSVIIPVCDEQGALEGVIQDVLRHLPQRGEVIVVDDGSRDDTVAVLRRCMALDARVRGFSLGRRRGKAHALHIGTRHARAGLIVTLDGDGQDAPSAIPGLSAQLRDADLDLVCGWRRDRKDSWRKRLPSYVINALLRTWIGLPLHDFNCGLKVYKREVARSVPLYGERHRYFPLLAWQQGYQVGELVVPHAPRLHGQTKYGPLRFFRSTVDLIIILVVNRYHGRPAHLFVGMGLLVFLVGMFINVALTIRWLRTGLIIPHHGLLSLGVLCTLVGLQGMLAGFLAEIVTRDVAGPPNITVKTLGLTSEDDVESS